jgi:hypothetical protein
MMLLCCGTCTALPAAPALLHIAHCAVA